MYRFLVKNKYVLVVVLSALVNLFLLWIFFGWQIDVDTEAYVATIRDIIEKKTAFIQTAPYRVLRPAGLLLLLPLTLWFSPLAGLIIENVIFYLITAYLIYQIAQEIFKKETLSLLSVVFYITAFPLLRFGPAALTDMGAWFCYVLSLYLTIKFIKKPGFSLVYLNGLISGLGILIKESGGMGILFFVATLILCKRFTWRETVKWLVHFLFVFLLPVVANQLVIYHYFNYSYFDWYIYNTQRYLKETYALVHAMTAFITLFGLGWLFFARGFYELIKRKMKENMYLLLALLMPSLSFFLWPALVARLMYIAGPLLSLVAAVGFIRVRDDNRLRSYILLILTIMSNYLLVWFSHLKWGL